MPNCIPSNSYNFGGKELSFDDRNILYVSFTDMTVDYSNSELDIKVFEGEFKTVVTERHVLKLKLSGEEDGEE